MNFEGGNPVAGVTLDVKSTNNGSNIAVRGPAVFIPEKGQLDIDYINKTIKDTYTFQAWVKPGSAFTDQHKYMTVFVLKNGSEMLQKVIKTKLWSGNNNYLEVDVDGSIFKLHNFMPAGFINMRGEETIIPVSNFNTEYTHISVVAKQGETPILFINGIEIAKDEENIKSFNDVYLGANPKYNGPTYSVEVPSKQVNLLNERNEAIEWYKISLGLIDTKAFFLDELRVWNSALDQTTIYNDYKRYIKGDHENLISYFRFDEGVGMNAYDLSHQGFKYNGNIASLENVDKFDKEHNVSWVTNQQDLPSVSKLGILGLTDSNGNYIITGIPYEGNGQSFEITPRLGVHEFSPKQQLVVLGEQNQIANQINFTDVSSFTFKGKVLFDTRGVFPSYVDVKSSDTNRPNFQDLIEGDEYIKGPGIIDEGYNYYLKGDIKYSKGDYWLNDAGTPGDKDDDYLERYARIGLEGANIYVDNNIVLDKNNVPVVSDSEGNFEIQVPIGNHFITVKKLNYEFEYEGRFPANSDEFTEFFQDREEQVTFIDKTRVDVVGRVVGGSIEAEKEIGFGSDGTYKVPYTDSDNVEHEVNISSVNNIGVANIIFEYAPLGAPATDYTKFNFSTNSETGEYRVKVLPLNYIVNQLNGVKIKNNNSNISILDANETINVPATSAVVTPTYELPDETKITGKDYHYNFDFIFRSTPVLRVVNQETEATIEIDKDGTRISTEGFEYPVYEQFKHYQILLERFEPYYNYDKNSKGDEFKVPVTDGEFVIKNNLALPDSESTEISESDDKIIIYKFRGGNPSITPPFTNTLSIKYRINGSEYEAQNYHKEAVLLGGKSDGSQTFVTSAPDTPDIILRDPPGSHSFATIEKGETISFTVDTDFTYGGILNEEVTVKAGVKFEVGGGLAGPVIESEATNNAVVGIGATNSSTEGTSLTKTYTFNQSISTSGEIDRVGADADLYIGQSKNYFYGTYNNIRAKNRNNGEGYELTNKSGESAFIGKERAVYFSEEPSNTFFVYTQRHILEVLIPELQEMVKGIDNGTIDPKEPGVLSKEQYEDQIKLWRSTIRENERVKYMVKNDRESYRKSMVASIDKYRSKINNALDDSKHPATEEILKKRFTQANQLSELVEKNFEDNVSFVAGTGEITRSIETTVLNTSSRSINLNTSQEFIATLGFAVNTTGVLSETTIGLEQDIFTELTQEDESTTTISYTLSDLDIHTLLSVDIVDTFDGNGPVFMTIGGRTSCPYEKATKSLFYDHETYDPDSKEIKELTEKDREDLNYGTQPIEVPVITAEVVSISNIPESNKAEFKILLENRSVTESATHMVLSVNENTNPHNAVTNIAKNGLWFYNFEPGKLTEYIVTIEKSVSDIYDYEDIEIAFEGECNTPSGDSNAATIKLSAHFTPSCTSVNVKTPLDKWVYNLSEAYNVDQSTNPLQIRLGDYNTSFSSFQKIDLQYRKKTSSTWTRLHTYYSTEAFYDDAVANNENDISLIGGANTSYAWDILGQNIQNGEYEIRAISTCTNNTEYISEVVSGTIDLIAPRLFGSPSPTNGILNFGDDLKVPFNESIVYNPAVSLIEVRGETNEQKIDHSVSLAFNSASNTMLIENPSMLNGDFTLEFWMKNDTESSATILSQEGGLEIKLNENNGNKNLEFKFGNEVVSGVINDNDNLFHHYAFVYNSSNNSISIYQDDREVATADTSSDLTYNFTKDVVIGGNTFKGNIHNLRQWSKALSLAESTSNIYTNYQGNEHGLIGIWPMNEGMGNLAKDLARFKHAKVNTSWDIKPRGTSYGFGNGRYLTCDNVNFVQITNQMSYTLSFWIKTDVSQDATIFSNGRGDNSENNTVAVNINTDGVLSLDNEGNSYVLTENHNVADGKWHHVAVLLNRYGNLNTYLDAELVSTLPSNELSGFYGSNIWIGARGKVGPNSTPEIDNQFVGYVDEVRLWNTLRSYEQIDRGRFNQVDINHSSLLLYLPMNMPDIPTGNGPRYYHRTSNLQHTNSLSVLSDGSVNYSNDAPPIKPARKEILLQVSHVINGDEMIIEPVINDKSLIERQVLDITVHRMFDAVNNMQQSPITWSAFVNQDQLTWTINNEREIVQEEINKGDIANFEINIINSGGTPRDFDITNVPDWLSLSQTNGTIPPSSSIIIQGSTASQLGVGNYEDVLYLNSNYGYDQNIQIKLDVNPVGPDWNVNPLDYQFSLNIVGKIKIDDVFSLSTKDKVAAFVNGEVRGVASLVYDDSYQDYFLYLTVYSNQSEGEVINFSIWEASTDNVYPATIGNSLGLNFESNRILGAKNNPKVFKNSDLAYQNIKLNSGWNWVSFFLEDEKFTDLNNLTKDLSLSNQDRILSQKNGLEVFDSSTGVWSGSITGNGGLSSNHMYKVYLAKNNSLSAVGPKVNLNTWSFDIQKRWNWLPYIANTATSVKQALTNFHPQEGDVIKSQHHFAIYDNLSGWSGNLEFLQPGVGYMLYSSNEQKDFTYPSYIASRRARTSKISNRSYVKANKYQRYSGNMNAVVEIPKEYSVLEIVDKKGNLRGEANEILINNKRLFFMTIHGEDTNEELVF